MSKKDTENAATELAATTLTPMGLLNSEVPIGSFLTNADLAGPDAMQVVFAAERPADHTAEEMVGQTIEVKYWVARKDEIDGRADEGRKIVIRCTVIDPEGKTFSATSKGVLKSLELLDKMVGRIPFDPPILMTLAATNIGKGGDF